MHFLEPPPHDGSDNASPPGSQLRRWLDHADDIPITLVLHLGGDSSGITGTLRDLPSMVSQVVLVGEGVDDTTLAGAAWLPSVCVVVAGSDEAAGRAPAELACSAATGDIIVIMDGHLGGDVREIPGLVGALLAGNDMVKGSRFMQGAHGAVPWHQRLAEWALAKSVNTLYGANYSDVSCAAHAIWRHALPSLTGGRGRLEPGARLNLRALRAALKVAEVPYTGSRRSVARNVRETYRQAVRTARIIASERSHPDSRVRRRRAAVQP